MLPLFLVNVNQQPWEPYCVTIINEENGRMMFYRLSIFFLYGREVTLSDIFVFGFFVQEKQTSLTVFQGDTEEEKTQKASLFL